MRGFVVGTALVLLLGAARASAVVTAAPGWAVHTIPTPAVVQGGVVRRGEALLVGQGSYGAGLESIVRLDAAGPTTIATGFNALGGFDLDAVGTLYVVDNCGECPGATTGDTLFAVPDALGRATPLPAAGLEVLPAGTIPAAQDVLLHFGGSVLVSDAAGVGSGRVVRVAGGAASDLVTGLDFLGGLAHGPDGALAVANVDATFVAAVLRFGSDGASLRPLATGLSGAFALVPDAEGNLLVSGGFADDGTSTVVALAPDGTASERARGFGFSSEMFFDAARDEVLVLDFGVSEITALCRDHDGDAVCDADDACPAAPDPAQADRDGDGRGDACDPCAAGAAARVQLRVKGLATPPGDDTLALRARFALSDASSLDPVATGARLVVEGSSGPIVDAELPGGAFDRTTGRGWRARRGTHVYRDRQGALGIRRAVIRTVRRRPDEVHVAITGREGAYAVAATDLPLRVTLVVGEGGEQCGETLLGGTTTAPACTFRRGERLLCR